LKSLLVLCASGERYRNNLSIRKGRAWWTSFHLLEKKGNGNPRFQAILAEAEVGRQQALAAFREAGGERLLGR
jgi:hypothetical protein